MPNYTTLQNEIDQVLIYEYINNDFWCCLLIALDVTPRIYHLILDRAINKQQQKNIVYR